MASILNNKYWINKSIIEKRENQKVAYKIKVYNNNVIDKYIEDFENDETIPKPSQATLYANLWILNKPHVNKPYQKIAKRESAIANRKNIMERSVKDLDYVRSQFGVNIQSNVFSYRDLENTAEALNRQTQMTASWDEYEAINQVAREKGLPDVYTQKEWIWTGEGMTTRHESNNGQIVGSYETFTIVNDANGDVDELMYPCDPNGSFSNAGICYCQLRAF